MNKRTALFLLALTVQLGCGDPTSPLDGAPYFQASINGRIWQPTDTTRIAAILLNDTLFALQASQGTPAGSTQSMAMGYLPIAVGRSTRLGSTATGASAGFIGPLDPGGQPYAFLTDSTHTGWLRILALDPATQTIVGAFEFVASRFDGQVVQVRQGRFRAHYVLSSSDPLSSNYRMKRDGLGRRLSQGQTP